MTFSFSSIYTVYFSVYCLAVHIFQLLIPDTKRLLSRIRYWGLESFCNCLVWRRSTQSLVLRWQLQEIWTSCMDVRWKVQERTFSDLQFIFLLDVCHWIAYWIFFLCNLEYSCMYYLFIIRIYIFVYIYFYRLVDWKFWDDLLISLYSVAK